MQSLRYQSLPRGGFPVKLGAIGGAIGLFVLFLVSRSLFSTVPEGHVGVVVNMGRAEDRILQPGMSPVWPFVSHVETLDVRPREYRANDLNAGTRDLQPLMVDVSVVYQWDRARALELYRSVGWRFDEKFVPSTVETQLKAVTADYGVIVQDDKGQIIGGINDKRDVIARDTFERIGPILAEYGLVVTQVQVPDIDLDPDYQKAVNEAQKQKQRTRSAEESIETAKKEARAAEERAEGEKQAAIKKAQGEAERIKTEADAKAYAVRQEADAEAHRIHQRSEALRNAPELRDYDVKMETSRNLPNTLLTDGRGNILLSVQP